MPVVGSTVMLAVTFRSSPGGPPVDVTDLSMSILMGSVRVVGPIPASGITRVDVGRYEYAWAIPLSTPPGTYTVQWSGVLPDASLPTVGYESVLVTVPEASDDDGFESFVTTSELKDYMSGIGLDADQASAMQDVLNGLQRELERYCRRKFRVRAYVEYVSADEAGRLWPKNTPVLDVLEPEGYYASGNQIIGPASWGAPVLVKYVAGLSPEDADDVRAAILRVASREATSLHSDVLDPNDLSARPARDRDNRVLGWTPEELAKFDRLRRRTVV